MGRAQFSNYRPRRRCRTARFQAIGTRIARLEYLENRRLLAVSPEGQYFVYELNLARHNPEAYAVAQNLGVDLSYVSPQPALAVNNDLFGSATFHAVDMATNNYVSHYSPDLNEWPNQMVRDQGYPLPPTLTINGTIYSLPDDSNQVEGIDAGNSTPQTALNSLIVDAGVPDLGHRDQLLGIGDFEAAAREIGVGHAFNSSSEYQDYWVVHTATSSLTQSFLTGVVYQDANNNQTYDQGEGLDGVTVTVGGYQTTTNADGGWSLPVPDGDYLVTASGGSLATPITVPARVQGTNVEVDFIAGDPQASVNFQPWTNTAPVLNNSVSPQLLPVIATSPIPSNLVGDMLANVVTDPDPAAVRGIAVTAADQSNGTWQFSLDGGNTWTPMGQVSMSSAMLLTSTDLLQFVPNTGFIGASSLSYAAWDQTSGTAGKTADLSAGRGGATAFSVAAATANVDVSSMNTAPQLTSGYRATLTSIKQDDVSPAGEEVGNLLGTGATDANSGTLLGMAIVSAASTANGAWQYSTDGGNTWNSMSGIAADSALLLGPHDMIRFLPQTEFNGTASFSFLAWDQSSGSAGAMVDVSAVGNTGGATAFSVNQGTASVTVLAVNHSPTLNSSADLKLPSIPVGTSFPTSTTVGSFVAGAISDPDPGALQGIAITGSTGDGAWYFNTNGGSGNWTSSQYLPTNAVLLRSQDLIGFLPNSGFSGTASITFQAWDQTSGSAGNFVDISSPSSAGGENAFSVVSATATQFVGNPSSKIQGRLFIDVNANGVDDGEPGISGWTVYLDNNDDGKLDDSEPSTMTAADGSFSFNNLPPGTYTVRAISQNGWQANAPKTGSLTITVGDAATSSGNELGFVTAQSLLHAPSVTNATTLENTRSTAGLVITPNALDAGIVTNFQITNITGGSLFLNDGMTAVTNGQFVTLAQGAAGLKFTPTTNSTAQGSFTVQAAASANTAGLGGSTVTATINVTPVVHTPTVTDASTLENDQTTSGLVITPNPLDAGIVANFQITAITGGSLFLLDGVTPVADGEFITLAQGEAGLRFTPSANSLTAGSFTAQSSSADTAIGLGGSLVVATITVTTAPSSSVAALPARTSLTSLPVSWSGTPGAGAAGITSYTIYESIDGGAYSPWLGDTTQTSANFAATIGNTYAFYSQATDTAGHTEAAHATPDAQVVVTSFPWHNSANPLDVIGLGGAIVPRDALLVIQYLNNPGSGSLPVSAPIESYYVDVVGNNNMEALDALRVIQALNSQSADIVAAPILSPDLNAAVPDSPILASYVAPDVASAVGAPPATAPTPAAIVIPAISASSVSSANSIANPNVGSADASTMGKPRAAKIETISSGSTNIVATSAGAGLASISRVAVDRALADLAIDWSEG